MKRRKRKYEINSLFLHVTISSNAPIDVTSQISMELLLSETHTNIRKLNRMKLISAFNICWFKVIVQSKYSPEFYGGRILKLLMMHFRRECSQLIALSQRGTINKIHFRELLEFILHIIANDRVFIYWNTIHSKVKSFISRFYCKASCHEYLKKITEVMHLKLFLIK